MKRKSIILLMILVLLITQSSMALAARYSGNQYDAYGNNSVSTSSDDLTWITNWLSDTSINKYKGGFRDNQVGGLDIKTRFRYVLPQFNPQSTSNWCGDNYTPSGYYQRVYEAQKALYYLGYTPLSNVDGYWGPTTKADVQDFQSAHLESVDGIVGGWTWTDLAHLNW